MALPGHCALASSLLRYWGVTCFGLLPEAPEQKVIKCCWSRPRLWVPTDSSPALGR